MTIPQTQNLTTNIVGIDSRTVAEWTNKEHYELMKDIRRYTEYLKQGKIPCTDFWQETTYKANNGKENPCYFITKKGCEFIQHKMTGQKGTIFTAKYINYFHDVEAGLHEAVEILLDLEDQPSPQPQTQKLSSVSDLTYIKNKLAELQDLTNLADISKGLDRIKQLTEIIGN